MRALDYSEVMELYEMRCVLEGTAARLAARSGTPTIIAPGGGEQVLTRIQAGEPVGTLLAPVQEAQAALANNGFFNFVVKYVQTKDPETDRTLLQDAAVLGKTFSADALSAIYDQEREALELRLEPRTVAAVGHLMPIRHLGVAVAFLFLLPSCSDGSEPSTTTTAPTRDETAVSTSSPPASTTSIAPAPTTPDAAQDTEIWAGDVAGQMLEF